MPKSTVPAAATGLPATNSIDPDRLPDEYAMALEGACMAPLLADGATVVCSRSESYEPGDLVALWFRPEFVAPGHHQVIVKRLLMAPPDFVKFPHRDSPGSEALPFVMLEMLNPRAHGWVECGRLLAIHKVIGTLPHGNTRRISREEREAITLGGRS
jgi:hypothetical protein